MCTMQSKPDTVFSQLGFNSVALAILRQIEKKGEVLLYFAMHVFTKL